jgi:hypothetical protein
VLDLLSGASLGLPGAVYHIMSRDDHRDDIFSDSGEIEFGKAQGREDKSAQMDQLRSE